MRRIEDLLGGRGPTWSTLSGRLAVWSANDLLEWGRFRFDEPRAPVLRSNDLRVRGGPIEAAKAELHLCFWARASPWGLRMEFQRADADGLPERVDDVLILTERAWWERRDGDEQQGGVVPDRLITTPRGERLAVFGDRVVADPGDWHVFPDTCSLDLMLRPGELLTGFDIRDVRAALVLGRAATRADSVPGPEDRFYRAARGLVALSADRYILDFDGETGILLDCRAFIAGIMASRHTISNLIVNMPLGKHVDGPGVPELAADE